MTEGFGPAGNKEEEQKAQSFQSPPVKTAQAQLEDMDEPEMDLSTPDERP